jgi:hypothetical protein
VHYSWEKHNILSTKDFGEQVLEERNLNVNQPLPMMLTLLQKRRRRESDLTFEKENWWRLTI